ncbi:uncharacterized protein ACLA_078630 [Aspergillus clavatus NRRL 1]|uniref:Uncharacterized protein n=1 Tax=Aspergillus clavatus (strain ATCC 1007 / CBS 513.65 / DSM 816 / NCTC 3887 / NRRL 1 / QM 1276 / 107) TaxID=344612 RepID=A1CLY5_ASPCL|nr:uncharacterized protein ACLA_078630 [Aspergillus clavatus NRRL 1]EAW09114.1 hypothetical protein ACLA_078630 [Aspergillus clavatus NRRL 1]
MAIMSSGLLGRASLPIHIESSSGAAGEISFTHWLYARITVSGCMDGNPVETAASSTGIDWKKPWSKLPAGASSRDDYAAHSAT